jgi:hypothetical protein
MHLFMFIPSRLEHLERQLADGTKVGQCQPCSGLLRVSDSWQALQDCQLSGIIPHTEVI